MKFGGTSMGSAERIRHVATLVKGARDAGIDVVVVVSAMSGETNRLVALAREMQPATVDVRELDVLLSTGEQVTIALLAMALKELGCPARSWTGSQVPMLTDSAHSKARILDIGTDALAGRYRAPERWRWWRASRAWTSAATSRRSGAAAPTRAPSRWRRR